MNIENALKTLGRTGLKGPWRVAVVVLALLLPGESFALSCARPILDEAAIAAATMIFEGTAGPKRPLDFSERSDIRLSTIATKGGGARNLRVYRFTVTKGWKGALRGQTVDVLFNTYWGDGFAAGGRYLLVSPRRVGKLFWAPLCGHSIDLLHAAKFGDIARLERLIGVGQHLKVKLEDRVCRRAEDCASVQTHCGDCGCGTPVAKAAAARYQARFDKLCAAIRVTERCEISCPPPAPLCKKGICVLK
jgi:hypothetical protein